jgi:Transposase
MAVTRDGIPVRCWTFPGNESDQVLIRKVVDDLRSWKLHRVVWVLDRGFTSEENRRYLQRAGGHYIVGEKLRSGNANHEALARAGRYRPVRDNLEVKEAWVGEGTGRRRFVVCRNPEEARRDATKRARALERIEAELSAIADKRDLEARRDAEALLCAHPTLGRYLRRRGGRLEVDQATVRAEERLDGKFLLSSSDDSLSAENVALGYKSLIEVERGWRCFKHVIDVRPVYHRKDERIRSHVQLCFLALLLMRVAEREVGDTWRNIRHHLSQLHAGTFTGPAGRVVQLTELTTPQRDILRALTLKEPPRFLKITPSQDA